MDEMTKPTPTPRTAAAVFAIAMRKLGPIRAFKELRLVTEELESELTAVHTKLARLRELVKAAVLKQEDYELTVAQQALRAELEKE